MAVQPDQETPSETVVVVDTGIASAILAGSQRQREAEVLARYDTHLRGKSLVLSFATVSELRYGRLKSGWGEARTRRMEDWFGEVAAVVMPDNDLVTVCATLRDRCRREGRALHEKIHDSDRWIASTAIRYGIPLLSDDGIFEDVPDLMLIRELAAPGSAGRSAAVDSGASS